MCCSLATAVFRSLVQTESTHMLHHMQFYILVHGGIQTTVLILHMHDWFGSDNWPKTAVSDWLATIMHSLKMVLGWILPVCYLVLVLCEGTCITP